MSSKGEIISYREFGRRLDVSDTAVRMQIRGEKYPNGALNMSQTTKGKRPALVYEVALLEWKNFGLKIGDNSPLHTGQPKISKQEKEAYEGPDADEEYTSSVIGRDDVMHSAKKHKAVYDAKLREIEYKKRIGELVDKRAVYKAFFEFGSSLREAILRTPDRIHEDMVNFIKNDDIKSSYNLLYKSLEDILERLTSGPDEKKITEAEATDDSDE